MKCFTQAQVQAQKHPQIPHHPRRIHTCFSSSSSLFVHFLSFLLLLSAPHRFSLRQKEKEDSSLPSVSLSQWRYRFPFFAPWLGERIPILYHHGNPCMSCALRHRNVVAGHKLHHVIPRFLSLLLWYYFLFLYSILLLICKLPFCWLHFMVRFLSSSFSSALNLVFEVWIFWFYFNFWVLNPRIWLGHQFDFFVLLCALEFGIFLNMLWYWRGEMHKWI